jgi:hypothetical protein
VGDPQGCDEPSTPSAGEPSLPTVEDLRHGGYLNDAHDDGQAVGRLEQDVSATAVFAARTISDAANTSNAGLAQANAALSHAPLGGAALAPDKSAEGKDSTTGTDDTTGTDATTGTKPTDNHGASVSAAANLSLDALNAACHVTLANKGAYISLIARGLYVFDATTGTCAPAPKTGTTSPSTSAGTAPTKLHGKADAKRAAHQP